MASLGDLVRVARIDKGWSQRELARRIGKSATYVHYLEGGSNPSAKGKGMQIPVEVVDTLAKVLQLDKDELRLTAGFAPEQPSFQRPPNDFMFGVGVALIVVAIVLFVVTDRTPD